jgi:hypothetical protein
MKKFLFFIFIVLFFQILSAREITYGFWHNIRNSSYTSDNHLHVRCEIYEFPDIATTLFYSTLSGWDSVAMQQVPDSTYTAIIPAMTGGETQYCRFRSEEETFVVMMPKYLPEDVPLPSISQLSLVSNDPVGDCVVDDADFLDITADYRGYSDTRFYTAFTTAGGGFPHNNGGFIPTYYFYASGFVNPEAVVQDTILYGLVYVNAPFYSPGLYKMYGTGTNIDNVQRIGDIEWEITGNTLIMACNIDSLTGDENFGVWPNSLNSLASLSITNAVSLLPPAHTLADSVVGSMHNFDQYAIEPFVNQLPVISDVTYTILDDTTEITCNYSDSDGHFPIVKELETHHFARERDSTYQMYPLSFDYSLPVPFHAEIPDINWDEIVLRFSDNGYEFVVYTIEKPAPASPENVIISIESGLVYIQWDEVPYASSYNVYSSLKPYSEWLLEESGITSTSWIGPASGAKKFYHITAE